MELARNLRAETVAQLRPTPPLSVQRDSAIGEAVKLMKLKQVGCLLVCEGKKLAGIFTERDLLQRVLAVGRPMTDPVCEVMTPDPVTVTHRDPIRKAMARMEKGGHRHLPVLDDSGRPTGILSVKRVVHYLAEHFPGTVVNQPDTGEFPVHRGGA